MPALLLAAPPGYDPNTQTFVGVMAACFDDQSRRLRETVAGLEVEHLEWQERSGRNTIGMLLAHLAGTEIGWFYVVCAGLSYDDGKPVVDEHLGINITSDNGGMPLPADGVHPASLKGRNLEGYFDLLGRARSATHKLLRTWDDASLDTTDRRPHAGAREKPACSQRTYGVPSENPRGCPPSRPVCISGDTCTHTDRTSSSTAAGPGRVRHQSSRATLDVRPPGRHRTCP